MIAVGSTNQPAGLHAVYSLLARIHYLPLTIHYSLLALHSSLFTLHSSLFTLHYSVFTIHHSLCSLCINSTLASLAVRPQYSASFFDATLDNTNFEGADLTLANIELAQFKGANFKNVVAREMYVVGTTLFEGIASIENRYVP